MVSLLSDIQLGAMIPNATMHEQRDLDSSNLVIHPHAQQFRWHMDCWTGANGQLNLWSESVHLCTWLEGLLGKHYSLFNSSSSECCLIEDKHCLQCMGLPDLTRNYWGNTIRYDTRCYFNVKADISQLNLLHGTQQLKSGKKTKK